MTEKGIKDGKNDIHMQQRKKALDQSLGKQRPHIRHMNMQRKAKQRYRTHNNERRKKQEKEPSNQKIT